MTEDGFGKNYTLGCELGDFMDDKEISLIREKYQDVVDACGDHSMTVAERGATYAYFMHGWNAAKTQGMKRDLAICQMVTLQTVMSFGGISIEHAIRELSLDRAEFEELARQENLGWIANEITKVIKSNVLD